MGVPTILEPDAARASGLRNALRILSGVVAGAERIVGELNLRPRSDWSPLNCGVCEFTEVAGKFPFVTCVLGR